MKKTLEHRITELEANQKWLIKLNWVLISLILANLIATIITTT